MSRESRAAIAAAIVAVVSLTGMPLFAQTGAGLLEGPAAFGDWHADRPGTRRLIRPQDLPAPDMAESVRNSVRIMRRTDDQKPIVPNGFEVNLFASGLSGPRLLRVAPNGDVFAAESSAGRIRVLRPNGNSAAQPTVFASGLTGPVRHRVLSARTRSAMGLCRQHRFRGPLSLSQRRRHGARAGRDHRAASAGRRPQDARRRVLAGRQDHVRLGRLRLQCRRGHGEDERRRRCKSGRPIIRSAPHGATRPSRADVLAFDPQGKNRAHLRHRHPQLRRHGGRTPSNGTLWCSTNERDGLGDNLPPDYITRVREGAFYGWPWYYIGAHEDPRHAGERPDLKDKITVPDVLIQPHSASLGMTFYNAHAIPGRISRQHLRRRARLLEPRPSAPATRSSA